VENVLFSLQGGVQNGAASVGNNLELNNKTTFAFTFHFQESLQI
jgi:hypothetical protein